jgi:hypothetical protein
MVYQHGGSCEWHDAMHDRIVLGRKIAGAAVLLTARRNLTAWTCPAVSVLNIFWQEHA